MKGNWLWIGGIVALVVIVFLFRNSMQTSSGTGRAINVPNTQDIWGQHALADAIANLNALWHPSNDGNTIPGPTGITAPGAGIQQGLPVGLYPRPSGGGSSGTGSNPVPSQIKGMFN